MGTLMRAIVAPDQPTADAHLAALSKCSAYTRDGRPPLPRCDSGKWNDPQIRQGRRCATPCPCARRDAPDPACPYVTHTATTTHPLRDGTVAIQVCRAHVESRGEVVDGVTITDAGAREITDEDREER